MSRFKCLPTCLFLFLLAVALGHAAPNTWAPTVKIRNGSLTGLHDDTWSQDYFLGIPYAQPPVGSLRLATPKPIAKAWKKALPVIDYGPACVSYGGDNMNLPMSEDCLTLNVVRGDDIRHGAKLPVAVWIHGGGFGDGSSRDQRYNLSAFVQHSYSVGTPIIGVSINYRLNMYGFLYSDDMVGTGNTNLGLRDQRVALHWIQDNIHAFGGDPSKVTIWGESAGATAVGLHLISYGGRDDDLFRGAIMESGSPLRSYMDPRRNQAEYDDIVGKLGCNDSISRIDCIRQAPLEQIHKVINGSGYGFFPTPDGDILRTRGSVHLNREEFVRVPILIGANTDEGTGFAPHPVANDGIFKDYLQNGSFVTKVPSCVADKIVDFYTTARNQSLEPGPDADPTNGAAWSSVATFTGDQNFIAARRRMCELWASAAVPAFCYRFNADNSATDSSAGVTHFEEIPFVFLNLRGLGYETHGGNPFRGKGPAYTDLAFSVAGWWISFIVRQDPTVGLKEMAAPNIYWPRYSKRDGQVFVIDANVTSHSEADNWRKEQIEYLNSLESLFKK